MAIETFTTAGPLITISAADDLLEIEANGPLEIIRAWAATSSQSIGTQQERLQLQELSSTGTGGGSGTAINHVLGGSGVSASIAYQVPAASQGAANGNPIIDQTFDVTTGFLWIASPSERIYLASGQIIALRFPSLTNAGNAWMAGITFIEYQ